MKKIVNICTIAIIACSMASLHGMDTGINVPGRKINTRRSDSSSSSSMTPQAANTLRSQAASNAAAKQHYDESMTSSASDTTTQPYTINLSEMLRPLIKRLMQTQYKEEKIRLMDAIKLILGGNMNQPINNHNRTVLMLAAHHATESRHLAILIAMIDEGADETLKTTRNNGLDYYLRKNNLADAFNRTLEQHRKSNTQQQIQNVENEAPLTSNKSSSVCIVM